MWLEQIKCVWIYRQHLYVLHVIRVDLINLIEHWINLIEDIICFGIKWLYFLISFRSQLVIGFQKVNKYLERDELRLVLANRESWLLIQHLALLVGIRKCPGMALPGLEHCLANRLGVSKLSAVGFKVMHFGKRMAIYCCRLKLIYVHSFRIAPVEVD